MYAVLAAIPYTTFPNIELGPLTLRTFGLMVALGVLVGARLGSDYGERFGVNREDTYRTGTLMVLAGIIGSRLTWAATHTESIHNVVDVIAIWRGGIQFSGGFIAALLVGMPMFLKWGRAQRWNVLNGYALGLAAGVGIGRIGCYSVGEHFGHQTNFFLATRYDGGDVREPFLGDIPLRPGMVFHNTALYEMLTMFALVLVMGAMIWRARRKGTEVQPGLLVAVFLLWAGIVRFYFDTLRVNDERFGHLTGAQWMSLAMVPYGLYVLFFVRPAVLKLVGPDGKSLEEAAPVGLLDATDDEATDDGEDAPDELAPPEKAGAGPDGDTTDDAEPTKVDAEAESDSDADEAAEPVEAESDEPIEVEAESDGDADVDAEVEPVDADTEVDDEAGDNVEPVEAEAGSDDETAATGDDVEPVEATAGDASGNGGADGDADEKADGDGDGETSAKRGFLAGDEVVEDDDVAAATSRD
jgi:phosphatidylglycerol:prolipoprotein diacylglycerol transferase